MAADVVEIVLKLAQVRQFVSGADQASKAIGKVGTTAEQSGKKAGVGWKSIAKWGGAATAVYGATKFLKGAVSTTEELAKSSMALNRTTGMNMQTSAEWAAVLKSRGMQTTQFQRGLVTLSKQMQAANTGTGAAAEKIAGLRKEYAAVAAQGGKKAPAALKALQAKIVAASAAGEKSRAVFARLGVSMDAIKRGDTQTVIMQVADAFAKMKNPAERAALAQKLFSRAGTALAPMLFKGSDAIREQLGLAGKYVHFGKKTADQVAEEMKHQRELQMAMMGVRVELGQALLPVMLSVTQLVVKITRVLQPLIRRGWLLKAVIIAIALAFVAYKAAAIAAEIATIGLKTALITSGIGAAIMVIALAAYLLIKHWDKVKKFFAMLWGYIRMVFDWIKNHWKLLAAILIGPFGIAAFAIYKYWDKIMAGIMTTWNWIKRNWPYLLGVLTGPFGLAAVFIIRHFSQIKNFVFGIIDAIRQKFEDLLNWIKGIPGRIGGWLKKIPGVKQALDVAGGAVGAAKSAGGWIKHPHLQQGGTITRSGTAIVGEAGPELLALPTAARVTPLPLGAMGAAGGGGVFEVRVPVFLDRRQIAEAVGQFTADKVARR